MFKLVQTWFWQTWSWHGLVNHGLNLVLILFWNNLLAVLDWLSILSIFIYQQCLEKTGQFQFCLLIQNIIICQINCNISSRIYVKYVIYCEKYVFLWNRPLCSIKNHHFASLMINEVFHATSWEFYYYLSSADCFKCLVVCWGQKIVQYKCTLCNTSVHMLTWKTLSKCTYFQLKMRNVQNFQQMFFYTIVFHCRCFLVI